MTTNKTPVSIVRYDGDLKASVKEAVSLAGGLPPVHGKTVVLKPNLVCAARSGSGRVTHQLAIAAVAELALDGGARVIVAEGSAVGFIGPTDQVDTFECYEVAGYVDMAKRLGLKLVDLNKDQYEEVPVPAYYGMPAVPLTRTLREADLIVSMPVPGSHPICGISAACKNFQGTLPWRLKRRSHRVGVDAGLSDVYSILRPGFAVLDGSDTKESTWPFPPPPHQEPLGLVLAGPDSVAVDATLCRVLGWNADSAAMLRFNAERGLGVLAEDQIDVRGLSVAEASTPWEWSQLRMFRSVPEVQWIYDEPHPCSACGHAAYQGVLYVKEAHGAQGMRGLRLAFGRSSSGRHREADIVIGDCAQEWASGVVSVPGRNPLAAIVAAEICRLRHLDPEPVIALRRQIPEGDAALIRPLSQTGVSGRGKG
jgi:uncharacterized protein (DUF362 family)